MGDTLNIELSKTFKELEGAKTEIELCNDEKNKKSQEVEKLNEEKNTFTENLTKMEIEKQDMIEKLSKVESENSETNQKLQDIERKANALIEENAKLNDEFKKAAKLESKEDKKKK